ncbi:hypothetical protein OG21DRAFT_1104390 [Imleria badia]|nr:hypothetical protein OG21DRAFT_1104390 [Imleria badia]
MLKTLTGGQSWTLEDLENHLEALIQTRYYIITSNGRVLFPDRRSGSLLSDTVSLRDKELTGFGVDRSQFPDGLASGSRQTTNLMHMVPLRSVSALPISDLLVVAEDSPLHITDSSSTSKSIHDLTHSSALHEDMQVEFKSPSLSPFSFLASDPIASGSSPSYREALDTEMNSFFMGSYASFKPRIAFGSDANESEDSTSAWSMSATPAPSGSHSSMLDGPPADNLVNCQWVDRGQICNEPVNGKSLWDHLKSRHGIGSHFRYEHLPCAWGGCAQIMKCESLNRHVKEKHMHIPRTVTKRYARDPS